MIVLGIEASGPVSGAALVGDDDRASVCALAGRGRHARNVGDAVAWLLEAAGVDAGGLDLVAVGRGPGSFTGLRVAMGVAKGIVFASGTPLVAVSSLAASAAPACFEDRIVLATADARRGEVYAALFCAAAGGELPAPLSEEEVVPLSGIGEWLAARVPPDREVVLVGDGARRVAPVLADADGPPVVQIAPPDLRSAPRPEAVARIGRYRFGVEGAVDPVSLDPRYLRHGPGGVA